MITNRSNTITFVFCILSYVAKKITESNNRGVLGNSCSQLKFVYQFGFKVLNLNNTSFCQGAHYRTLIIKFCLERQFGISSIGNRFLNTYFVNHCHWFLSVYNSILHSYCHFIYEFRYPASADYGEFCIESIHCVGGLWITGWDVMELMIYSTNKFNLSMIYNHGESNAKRAGAVFSCIRHIVESLPNLKDDFTVEKCMHDCSQNLKFL